MKNEPYKIAIKDLSGIQSMFIEASRHEIYTTNTWYAIAFAFAIESMERLQKIEQIVSERSYTDEIGNAMYYTDEIRIEKIKEVLDE